MERSETFGDGYAVTHTLQCLTSFWGLIQENYTKETFWIN
jgi:hypothetical protein